MRDLSVLREDGDSYQWEEIRVLRATTIQESLRQWLWLQQSFEWQLQKTDELFELERREAMADLQARILRLVD